ncbi:recombinase family protein [Peribacillus simplex]|uniref:recombinase family protein n=1 Tax=Peribacillus simplex TaxID=1478 RepID=UPI002E2247AA|nr:recombinase family protein [Peribacillus simplex]
MKTTIYARKSTLKLGQKETIENQIKICKRAAEELGLEVVDIKTDAATGTDDNNRPEVKSLIKDAVKGNYDCVIMKGISRLYRKTSKGLELIERLDQNNIRVVTVEEHFDSHAPENRTGTGKLDLSRLTMYLMFAEMESKKLADRIKYTQIEKAHAGEWNQVSSVPYGYLYDPTTKKLEIDPYKSEIVKLIFDQYLQGKGMKSIAFYLNGDNKENKIYPSPKSKRWSEYTIGFILKNQVYIGDIVYNKRSKKERPYKQPELIGKSDEDVYIGNDYNEKEKWIITKGAHDAIIETEIFEQAQSIMNVKAQRKGIRNNISLLAGIGKCGLCGSGLTFKRGRKNTKGQVVTKDNYYCMNYIRYGKQFCTSHHMGALELEMKTIKAVKVEIEKKLKMPEVVDGVNATSRQMKSLDSDIKKIENNIEALSHKMNILLEKNIGGDINDMQYTMMNDKYKAELESLVTKLEKLKLTKVNNAEEISTDDRLQTIYEKTINIENLNIEDQRYILLDLVKEVRLTDGKVLVSLNF